MQLHYIWVKDFKNIREQGFSFSDKYLVSYDQGDYRLKIVNNPRYILNFFPGGVNSVTGIIGANGAGKSNLFEFIKYTLASFSRESSTLFNLETILVFEKYVCSHVNIKIENEAELQQQGFEILRFKDSLPYLVDASGKDTEYTLADNHPLYENAYIYYSNIFDSRGEDYLFELVDISTNHLVASDVMSPRYNTYSSYIPQREIDSVSAYYITETERQFEFLSENDKSLPFNLPDSVIVRIEHNYNKYLSTDTRNFKENNLTAFNEIWHYDWGDLESVDPEVLKQIYRRMFIYKLLIILQNRDPENFTMISIEQFSDLIFNENRLIFEKVYSGDKLNELSDFLTSFDQMLNYATARKRQGKYDTSFEYHDIIDLPLNEVTMNAVTGFFKRYRELVGGTSFLAFHWEGLSSGEQALFNIYSRFHYAFKRNVVIKSNHVVILLDEAETSLHPAWQGKLFNDLIVFFNQNLPDKTIQLIITSHSPFLVSDLPKTMINFLDRDSKGNCLVVDGLLELKNTFGANINTLYSDSFFMKQTLMGDFAKSKIDKLINVVNREKDFDEEFPSWEVVQQYIDLMGEPLIRSFLQKQLNNNLIVKQGDVVKLREEIKKLEYRLKKIEGQDDTN